jgi:hypothetical protein
MHEEACVAKLLSARWTRVETSAKYAGASQAALAFIDVSPVRIDPAYRTKLTEANRNNLTSGYGAHVWRWRG